MHRTDLWELQLDVVIFIVDETHLARILLHFLSITILGIFVLEVSAFMQPDLFCCFVLFQPSRLPQVEQAHFHPTRGTTGNLTSLEGIQFFFFNQLNATIFAHENDIYWTTRENETKIHLKRHTRSWAYAMLSIQDFRNLTLFVETTKLFILLGM